MTEEEYIKLTYVTKIRIAKNILSDLIQTEEHEKITEVCKLLWDIEEDLQGFEIEDKVL